MVQFFQTKDRVGCYPDLTKLPEGEKVEHKNNESIVEMIRKAFKKDPEFAAAAARRHETWETMTELMREASQNLVVHDRVCREIWLLRRQLELSL